MMNAENNFVPAMPKHQCVRIANSMTIQHIYHSKHTVNRR
jgi:hypothetical protein